MDESKENSLSSSNSEGSPTSVLQFFCRDISLLSSEEDPIEEWSSLIIKLDIPESKVVLGKKGLYDPGSGEICAKYIPISDSDILRHPYYAYPSLNDPGILAALQKPETKKRYELDGKDLYMDLCEEMKVIPVRKFYRGLLDDNIDLKYYGVNPNGVRAMCYALNYNKYVRRLDLTSNFLNDDACFHIGRLLAENFSLQELILSRCRLNISHNKLTAEGVAALAAGIEFNNKFTSLNISWNKLHEPKGVNALLRQLGDSKILVELNMSWSRVCVGRLLARLLRVPTLKVLNLSDNSLSTFAAKAIASRLRGAKNLRTLDLSRNPLKQANLQIIVTQLRSKAVKLTNLYFDDIIINKAVMQEITEVLELNHRKNTVITHGKVEGDYILEVPDIREIVLKRLQFIGEKSKSKMDVAVYFLQEEKVREEKIMLPQEVMKAFKYNNVHIDDGLILELTKSFPGRRTEKGGLTINLTAVREFINRLWPDKKPPPTPPPTPPPEPEKKEKKKK